MVQLMFLLSGENIELAKREVLALAQTDKFELDKNILIVDSEKFEFSRLAYTKKAYQLIFRSWIDELEKNLRDIEWEKYYKKDFCLRARGFDEAKLASFIWNRLEDPKVNLDNSSMQVEILKGEDKAYCGIKVYENKDKFKDRSPHLRPGFHPSGIIPKLAKALVNLTYPADTIYDPFCGTGGILIEAALIGLNVVGSDIDPKMVSYAKLNLEHMGIEKYDLMVEDATNISSVPGAIVSDMPYGRSSSTHSIKPVELYNRFLDKAYQVSDKGQMLVLVAPATRQLSSKFKELYSIDHYVHKTLTRRIHVFKKE